MYLEDGPIRSEVIVEEPLLERPEFLPQVVCRLPHVVCHLGAPSAHLWTAKNNPQFSTNCCLKRVVA